MPPKPLSILIEIVPPVKKIAIVFIDSEYLCFIINVKFYLQKYKSTVNTYILKILVYLIVNFCIFLIDKGVQKIETFSILLVSLLIRLFLEHSFVVNSYIFQKSFSPYNLYEKK